MEFVFVALVVVGCSTLLGLRAHRSMKATRTLPGCTGGCARAGAGTCAEQGGSSQEKDHA